MQAITMLCDNCSAELEMSNRVQIIIFTTEPIADPQIDLCSKCAAPVVKNATVKSAHGKAQEHMMGIIQGRQPETEVVNPELPPDDYEIQVGKR